MESNENKIISTGEWIGTFILTSIPIIGWILLFMWAFGGPDNQSKSNWAKAILFIMAIFILGAIAFVALASLL